MFYESIARPYALAAFNSAVEKNALDAWLSFLQGATQLSQDTTVSNYLKDPLNPRGPIASLYRDVLKSLLNDYRTNFLNMMVENKRLLAFPAILAAFEAFKAEKEKTTTLQITSAQILEDAEKEKLAQALSKRFGDQVLSLHYDVDPSLLGGAIIRTGDQIIDGSLKNRLNQLARSLGLSQTGT